MIMNRLMTLLALGGFMLAVGCSDKPDPRSRPGFVDTSDPSKLKMDKLPKSKGGGMGAGAGKPPDK